MRWLWFSEGALAAGHGRTAGDDTAPAASGGRRLRVRFIRNSRAGPTRRKIGAEIRRRLPLETVDYDVVWTKGPGHAVLLARAAAAEGIDVVVAVGGDGTVNEVGRGLMGAPATAMGIIPTGSGNGFARHLGVPLSVRKALERLPHGEVRTIDVGRINGRPFFCTAGLGFDALVSRKFADSKVRGLPTYVRATLEAYGAYTAPRVRLRHDDVDMPCDCYVLAFANASQYGNNALIAPLADVSDGYLDVCLIESMSLPRAIRVLRGLVMGDLPKSRAIRYARSQKIRVEAPEPVGFHVDGDYAGEASAFDVDIIPSALRVWV